MGKLYMNEELFGSDDSKDIKYDNSTSQIEADNVQGAIDYLVENGGSSIAVDNKLDLKSENPVQNKVIAASLNGIDTLLDYILGNEIETSNVYKIFDGAGVGEGGALE